jgi:hypothetical protein
VAVTLVGSASAIAKSATAKVTPVIQQPTTAGDLLVCCAAAGTNTGFTISGPTGWVNAAAVGQSGNRVEIWYKPSCGAGETAPTVNCSLAVAMRAEITEWAGVLPGSPLDTTGTATGLAVASLTVTTAANVGGGGGGLGIAMWSNLATQLATFWTPGANWSNATNNYGDGTINFFQSVDYLLNPPITATLSELGTSGASGQVSMSAVIATFLAAPAALAYGYAAN